MKMKKYIIAILLFLVSFASYSQTVQQRLGIDATSGNPALYKDTVIIAPYIANYFLNGNKIFQKFDSTARLSLSLTTTGTSGAATYNNATGIFNIPQYSGGSSYWTNSANDIYNNNTHRVFVDSIYVGKGNKNYYNYSNIAIGDSVLKSNTTGTNNVGIGDSVLYLNTTGYNNTAIGSRAMQQMVSGFNNTAIGNASMGNATGGNNNFALGLQALNNNTGNYNIAIGTQVASSNTGNYNIFIATSPVGGTSGSYNTGIGYNALAGNISGSYNAMFGLAGASNTTASRNTGMGYAALNGSPMTGGDNSAYGSFSSTAITSGTFNSSLGSKSLYTITSGSYNIGIGYLSGTWLLGGSSTFNTTGSHSIFIGDSTRANADGQINQIVIGNNVTGLGSHTAVIGDSTQTKMGVFGNLELQMLGNKIKIPTGTNSSAGQATLVGGTVTVSTTAVTASSLIFLTNGGVSGTQGFLSVGTITAGTSFVINSSSGTDTSTINWIIIN